VTTTARRGVAIEFVFPLGRYHATAAGTVVNEAEVEWPPSPWRILRALVSVWKRRCPALDERPVLALLDSLATPCAYALPPYTRGHTRHYLRGEKGDDESTFLTLDPFVSCARGGRVVVLWPDAEIVEEQRSVLAMLCSQLTYLGRAESLCDARLMADDEMWAASVNAMPTDLDDETTDADAIRLLVPIRPLDFESLCVRLAEMRSDRRRRAVVPSAARYVRYSRPRARIALPTGRQRESAVRPITSVRFALVGLAPDRSPVRPPLQQLVLYTSVLRDACQSAYGKLNAGNSSEALSGRSGDLRAVGHTHAHYLALPDSSGRRIDGFVVWVPRGLGPAELSSVTSVQRLFGLHWVSDFTPAGLLVTGFGDVASAAPDLCGPSARFVSLTPLVPGLHPKRANWGEHIENEVRSALAERRLPDASEITVSPWNTRGFRTRRPASGARKPTHAALNRPCRVELRFPEPIAGPLCLGALSHFGFGLFEPVDAAS
jgi:CRISPR-associated protein Csb2